ncbi:hypothetical protein B9G53_23690 [Pseudanabaena sp. SR411]|uniref:hypothetical protein n=1 Tax=Pseudanabaena sp. SR411 TaxID=1980935 RepID=UPI000B98525A|nr:hypothetical protein [Pseudanabaena sp. SR411]OYQ62162.1 hypothetical protein B9G53_23690 [Pseudanabaena sp. SR411]
MIHNSPKYDVKNLAKKNKNHFLDSKILLNCSNEEKLKIAAKIQLAEKIHSNPKLQAIAELAGKKIAIAAKMQRTKVKEGQTEIVEVTTSTVKSY